MHVRLSDRRCLAPRLLGGPETEERRVLGLLEARDDEGRTPRHRLVHEVRYDGRICRYRVRDGAAWRWLTDEDASGYRPFCHLIIERLAARDEHPPRLHRLPVGTSAPATLDAAASSRRPRVLRVLDSCLVPTTGLWLRAALDGTDAAGWLPLATLPPAA